MRESVRIRTMARKSFKEYKESQELLLAKRDLLEKLRAYTRDIDPTQELRAITGKQDLFLDPIFGDKYCFEDDDYCSEFCEDFGTSEEGEAGYLQPCASHRDLVMYDISFDRLLKEEASKILTLIDFLENNMSEDKQEGET